MVSEDAGKSFITLDMDEPRELRWNFRNLQRFEGRAKDILKRHEVFRPGMPIHTGYILSNYIKIADILEAAVGVATGLSALENKKGEPSEAAQAIQGYLEKGGSIERLQREVYHSYLMVNDPSLIGEWQENLVREDETRHVNKEKKDAQLEIAKLELADDLKKIENLKKASGSGLQESATSS
jgi:hypothetical protein